MATKKFDFNVLQVGTGGEGDISRAKAQTIAGQKIDHNITELLGGLAQGASLLERVQASEDNYQGKMEGLKIKNESANIEPSQRADYLKKQLDNAHGNKSKGYFQGFSSVMYGAYGTALAEKEENRVATAANLVKSETSTFLKNMDTGFNVDENGYEVPFNPDKMTTDFAGQFQIPTAVAAKAVYLGGIDVVAQDISDIQNRSEFTQVQDSVNKYKQLYGSNHFRGSKAKKFQELVTTKDREVANMFAAKNRELILKSNNYLASVAKAGFNQSADELDYHLREISIDSKTGQLDAKVYLKNREDYIEKRAEYQEYMEYQTSFDPTTPLDYSQEKNKMILNQHESDVSFEIFTSLASGNEQQAYDITQAQGKYLGRTKAELVNILFNNTTPLEDKTNMWSQVADFAQSPTGSMVLQNILGKDTMSEVLAVSTATKYTNMTLEQSLEAVKKLKANPDDFKQRDKDVAMTISELGIDYGPLSNEFRQVVTLATAGGSAQDKDTIRVLQKMFDERVTEIGGVRTYKMSGDIPKATKAGEDYYNQLVEDKLQEFKRMNADGPVWIEVLEDGKAIVKDAVFGNKVGGYIDLKMLADVADRKALSEGMTTRQKVGTLADVAISGATNIYSLSGMPKVRSMIANKVEDTVTKLEEPIKAIGTAMNPLNKLKVVYDKSINALYNSIIKDDTINPKPSKEDVQNEVARRIIEKDVDINHLPIDTQKELNKTGVSFWE